AEQRHRFERRAAAVGMQEQDRGALAAGPLQLPRLPAVRRRADRAEFTRDPARVFIQEEHAVDRAVQARLLNLPRLAGILAVENAAPGSPPNADVLRCVQKVPSEVLNLSR